MFTCQFCGMTGSEEEDFQIDRYNRGYWCECCDGYTYLEENSIKHRFTLILEDKNIEKLVFPPTSKKLSKRLSPYRFPGGKSKIIDYLYSHLEKVKTKKLISPFTGGGSFELSMLEAGVVEELHLNDLDTGVFSLWWMIKHMPYVLIERLNSLIPNHRDYYFAQTIIKSDYRGVDMVDAAWASLLVNRLAYSGIFKANPLGGKYGSKQQLLSRWNPTELIRRIKTIHEMSGKIEITQETAIELIEEAYWDNQSTIFIDPPYVNKGKDLYHCYFKENDHRELAFLLDSLYHGCPGADILVTYDYSKWLEDIYEYPKKEVVGRIYSA